MVVSSDQKGGVGRRKLNEGEGGDSGREIRRWGSEGRLLNFFTLEKDKKAMDAKMMERRRPEISGLRM